MLADWIGCQARRGLDFVFCFFFLVGHGNQYYYKKAGGGACLGHAALLILWSNLEDQHLIGTALRAVLIVGALILIVGCQRGGIIHHGLCGQMERKIKFFRKLWVGQDWRR